jgi:hypothetical protein
MRSIKEILIDRDGMTVEEADELIEAVREDINFAAECGDYELAEDIMLGDLGLEMDYIFELLI